MSTTTAAVLAVLVFGWAVFSGALARRNVTGPLIFAFAGYVLANPSWGPMPVDVEASSIHLIAEVTLALLLFTDARAATRTDSAGAIVTLEDAQRQAWNRDLIEEGLELAAEALKGGGRFALEAGISGLHSSARDWKSTDWPAICRLYDRLVESWPSPAAILARLVARSFVDLGPRSALALSLIHI